MKAFNRVAVFCLLCAVSFSYGCARPDDAKRDAVAGANEAFSELRISSNQADAMGTPVTSWSEEKLAAYEDLMTRIEVSANRAQTFDGKSGIVIKEADGLTEAKANAAAGKILVKKVRTEKVQLAIQEAAFRAAKIRLTLIQGLQQNIGVMAILPTSAWTTEAISAHERVVDHAESAGKQLAFLAVTTAETDLSVKVEKLVQIQRAALENARRH